jgi:hypothetical protein
MRAIPRASLLRSFRRYRRRASIPYGPPAGEIDSSRPRRRPEEGKAMNRNILFAIIGALAVTSGVLGYHFYQESREPTGLQITVGKTGVSIDKK